MSIWARLVCTLLVTILASLPTDFFLLIRHFAEPQGFWQNLVIFGLGFYFLGAIQVMFLIFWAASIVVIWSEP